MKNRVWRKRLGLVCCAMMAGQVLSLPIYAEDLQIIILDPQESFSADAGVEGDVSVEEADGFSMEAEADSSAETEYIALNAAVSEGVLTDLSESTLPQIVTSRGYQWEWSDVFSLQLAAASWDKVSLQNASEYPELNEALQSFNKGEDSLGQQHFDTDVSMAEEALQMGVQQEYFQPYSYNSEVLVRRADDSFVSMLLIKTAYAGGTHDSVWYQGRTYRTDSEFEVRLSDLVTNEDTLLDTLYEALRAQFPDLSGLQTGQEDTYWSRITAENLVWTLEAESITFYFDEGRLGSVAEGRQIISLAYEEYPDLFTDLIEQSPEAAVCELTDGAVSYMDVNHDGLFDQISFQAVYDEYDSISGIEVTVNSHTVSQNTYGYSVRPTVMRNKNGTYFLAELTMDNDYRQTMIFYLSGDSPSYVTTIDAGLLSWPGDNENVLYTEHITDPSDFRLQTRTDVLGTSSVYRRFALAEDGTPTPLQSAWNYCYDRTLLLKQNTEVDVLADDTGVLTVTGDKMDLAAGAKVKPIQTDNQTYVDLLTEDGSYVRMEVDMTNYPFTANGVDVYEMFEGILFAG